MTSSTLHLPRQDLIRYAVTSGPPSARLAHVVRHLDKGCQQCTLWIERYRQAVASTRPSTRPQGVPASWVRPRRLVDRAGLRSGALADTSLICTVGPFGLEVLVRPFETPRSLEVAGQITRADRAHEPVAELPVSLVEPHLDRVVTATSTDPFGEFDLAADGGNPYGLQCGSPELSPCVLVWEGGL